jgi:hypothetical protein
MSRLPQFRNKQDVRRSQFITTYGPGSVIVGPGGPAVILMPEVGLFGHLQPIKPSDFEIPCEDLNYVVGGKIFQVPSNQELRIDKPIYRTKSFPEWHLCPPNKSHENYSILYETEKCPKCGNHDHRNAIRFVMACPKGHLDDVDWEEAVHGDGKCNKAGGRTPYFKWFRQGPTLWQVKLECAFCGAHKSMGYIYYNWNKCRGRFPEREGILSPQRGSCSIGANDRKPTVLHIGALNLHMPVIYSALKISQSAGRLNSLLQNEGIKSAIKTLRSVGMLNEQYIRKVLGDLDVENELIDELLSYSPDEIVAATETSSYQPSLNYGEMIIREFRALKKASSEGSDSEDLAISLSEVKRLSSGLVVVPIECLSVVMVQKGYQRVDPIDGRIIEVYHEEPMPGGDTQKWFLGVKVMGEGIFVYMDTTPDFSRGPSFNEWNLLYQRYRAGGGEYKEHLFRNPNDRMELHPSFVWWHSFSHKLITSLAVDSGYSLGSLRERVYFDGSSGGVLIYASQPGSDGGLGGLIGLVDRFDDLLRNTLNIASLSCSNDPFCSGVSVSDGSYVGAACYACLFLPETCCEHRNMWLDRRLLVENNPYGVTP